MGSSSDDDLAEIETTPEDFARYKARSEPARLIDPPDRSVGVRTTAENTRNVSFVGLHQVSDGVSITSVDRPVEGSRFISAS